MLDAVGEDQALAKVRVRNNDKLFVDRSLTLRMRE